MKLIIEAIEEKLQSLKNELYFKDLQIAELRAQLEHAENQLADMRAGKRIPTIGEGKK